MNRNADIIWNDFGYSLFGRFSLLVSISQFSAQFQRITHCIQTFIIYDTHPAKVSTGNISSSYSVFLFQSLHHVHHLVRSPLNSPNTSPNSHHTIVLRFLLLLYLNISVVLTTLICGYSQTLQCQNVQCTLYQVPA